jgi:AraC-like DNA-binding protein
MESYPKEYLYTRVIEAKIYIDKSFCEKLDLAAIARSANYSKYHFFRLFKEMYGVTPLHYTTSLRIEKSKMLLAQDLTILEVANLIGFDSPTSFSAVFKKYTHINPSQFKHHLKCETLQKKETPLLFIPNCFAQSRGWLKK